MGLNKKADCPECGKNMRKDNLKRHMKTHKPKEKVKRLNRTSTNFFLTFQHPCKYALVKRLKMHMGNPWVKGLTIGNEWGSGYQPNGHCHVLLSVEQGYSLEHLKSKLMDDYRIVPADVQVAKSVKDSVRYISKEDYKCMSSGHDKDYLSVICKAYLYSLKQKKFRPTEYPYCQMVPWQKKEFKEFLEQFYHEQEYDNIIEEMDNIELKFWQKKALHYLINQGSRKVLWIYDEIGGIGKTTLAKYLAVNHDAVILHNGSTPDLAMAYNRQPYVVFDYTRTEEKINYKALEHLKNGIIFSSKYISTMKFFTAPKILCLSNKPPDISGLSEDRWHILEFVREKSPRGHWMPFDEGYLKTVLA